jgi:hypothetical protein
MRRLRVRFTVRLLMITTAVIATTLGGGITAVRLIGLSQLYSSQAAKHSRSETAYRTLIDTFDSRFLRMPRSGGALHGYVYHEKLVEHHRALRLAYERAAMRPWETAPDERPEPTFDALRPELGRRLIRLAVDHHLDDLQLSDMGLTDNDLTDLARCPDLLFLDLSRNPITDRGVSDLRGLRRLRRLDLYKTQVTDAGLSALQEMTDLADLGLFRTGVTHTGIELLKRALPNTDVASNTRLN